MGRKVFVNGGQEKSYERRERAGDSRGDPRGDGSLVVDGEGLAAAEGAGSVWPGRREQRGECGQGVLVAFERRPAGRGYSTT